jgi:hypothetical protein
MSHNYWSCTRYIYIHRSPATARGTSRTADDVRSRSSRTVTSRETDFTSACSGLAASCGAATRDFGFGGLWLADLTILPIASSCWSQMAGSPSRKVAWTRRCFYAYAVRTNLTGYPSRANSSYILSYDYYPTSLAFLPSMFRCGLSTLQFHAGLHASPLSQLSSSFSSETCRSWRKILKRI